MELRGNDEYRNYVNCTLRSIAELGLSKDDPQEDTLLGVGMFVYFVLSTMLCGRIVNKSDRMGRV